MVPEEALASSSLLWSPSGCAQTMQRANYDHYRNHTSLGFGCQSSLNTTTTTTTTTTTSLSTTHNKHSCFTTNCLQATRAAATVAQAARVNAHITPFERHISAMRLLAVLTLAVLACLNLTPTIVNCYDELAPSSHRVARRATTVRNSTSSRNGSIYSDTEFDQQQPIVAGARLRRTPTAPVRSLSSQASSPSSSSINIDDLYSLPARTAPASMAAALAAAASNKLNLTHKPSMSFKPSIVRAHQHHQQQQQQQLQQNTIAPAAVPNGLHNTSAKNVVAVGQSAPKQRASIVRSGPIITTSTFAPLSSSLQQRSFEPSSLASLAAVLSRTYASHASSSPERSSAERGVSALNKEAALKLFGGVGGGGGGRGGDLLAHSSAHNLAASESSNYNTMQDYVPAGERPTMQHQQASSQSHGGGGGGGSDSLGSGQEASVSMNSQVSPGAGMNDDQRVSYAESMIDGGQDSAGGPPSGPGYRTHNSSHNKHNGGGGGNNNGRGSSLSGDSSIGEHHNSRSSLADSYKSRESASTMPLRSSVDPFEDVTAGLSTSEYERDLADLDEEFNRHTSFARRPSASSAASLMGEPSYMSLSPERYEARRFNRRPSMATFDFGGSSDYLSSAPSMSSVLPRHHHHHHFSRSNPWSSASTYSDSIMGASDMWSDSASDFSPLASFMSPSQYHQAAAAAAYNRWRAAAPPPPPPRYQRLPAAAMYSGGPFLSASASEHHLQPAAHTAYSLVPAGSYAPAAATQMAAAAAAAPQTETISFTLSPLAAAAAAAASALAAADKSRHHGHHWITIPRLASSLVQHSAAASSSSGGSSAAQQQATAAALPAAAAAIPTAYYAAARPAYAYGAPAAVPIYAIAPRPAAAAPTIATAASGTAPAIIPAYYAAHPAAPTLIAYRATTPNAAMMAPSMLAASSFAYPMRLPMAASVARPIAYATAPTGARPISYARPYEYQQQAQETTSTKSTKANNNNNADASNSSVGSKLGPLRAANSLSAMARNLTRKMFGAASQIRPQHVAPPSGSTLHELLGGANANNLAGSSSVSSSSSSSSSSSPSTSNAAVGSTPSASAASSTQQSSSAASQSPTSASQSMSHSSHGAVSPAAAAFAAFANRALTA